MNWSKNNLARTLPNGTIKFSLHMLWKWCVQSINKSKCITPCDWGERILTCCLHVRVWVVFSSTESMHELKCKGSLTHRWHQHCDLRLLNYICQAFAIKVEDEYSMHKQASHMILMHIKQSTLLFLNPCNQATN